MIGTVQERLGENIMAQKRRVYIYPVPQRDADIEDLRIALKAIDCAEEVGAVGDAEVVVVLICVDTPNDARLAEIASAAANGKLQAVGIYAGDSDGSLPEVLERYGTSAIPLDLDKLRRVICGGERIWTDAGGKPRAEQEMDRHCK